LEEAVRPRWERVYPEGKRPGIELRVLPKVEEVQQLAADARKAIEQRLHQDTMDESSQPWST